MSSEISRADSAQPTFTERLVNRLASLGQVRASRRSFVAAAALTGTALAVDPWSFITRPQDAYASVCGTGASCSDGYSVFCCTINKGHNTCPPNTYPGGWWKADRSSFCGGAARYYIDCNAKPGHHFTCHCNKTSCDHRLVACNVFRYGQCNTQVHGVTAVVCRQISCLPPWRLYPGKCGTSSATDNNTARHNAPCLTKANSNPNLVTFPKGTPALRHGHSLHPGDRLVARNRHTEATFGKDGNFTVRNEHGIVWQTHTAGVARGGRVVLYASGLLEVRDSKDIVRWRNHPTRTLTSAVLWMHDNGDLTVGQGSVVVFHTNTHTP